MQRPPIWPNDMEILELFAGSENVHDSEEHWEKLGVKNIPEAPQHFFGPMMLIGVGIWVLTTVWDIGA